MEDGCIRAISTIEDAVVDQVKEDEDYTDDEIVLIGYLMYIIAGLSNDVVSEEIMRRFCVAHTDGSKLSINLMARKVLNEYSEAKAISDTMMENESTLDEILEVFTDRICKKCGWEKTESNDEKITGALHRFYTKVQGL